MTKMKYLLAGILVVAAVTLGGVALYNVYAIPKCENVAQHIEIRPLDEDIFDDMVKKPTIG